MTHLVTRRIYRLGPFVAALLLALGPRLAQSQTEYTFIKIADTGTNGIAANALSEAARINNSGTVAFNAGLSGAGGGSAIFVGDGTSLVAFDSGTGLLREQSGINDSGTLFYRSPFQLDGIDRSAYWTGYGVSRLFIGAPQVVIVTTIGNGLEYNIGGMTGLDINNSGTVLFQTGNNFSSGPFAGSAALLTTPGFAIVPFGLTFLPYGLNIVGNLAGGSPYQSLGHGSLNDDGWVAFQATTVVSGVPVSSVFLHNGSTVQKVVDATDVLAPSLNNNGVVAFAGTVAGVKGV